MKKYLLGTTALVGASVVASGAMAMPIQSKSESGTPILTASMVAQFEAGIADNDSPTASANTRDGGFVNGRFAEIFFNGELTADNGLVYGAKIHFATGRSNNANTDVFPGREYIYLSGGWGSLEFGNWIGADSGLNLCLTCNTYAGYGGLDTPWNSYVINPAPDVSAHRFGLRFNTRPTNKFWFDQSVKATYYTPVFAGFQAGISYTPTQNGFGEQLEGPQTDAGQASDILHFGAQWNGDFGGVGVAVSAVGAASDGYLTAVPGTTGATNSLRRVSGHGYYELGAVVRYAGFQFGGLYYDEGTGGMISGRDYNGESYGWALDAAYFFGPYGIEVQYLDKTTTSANRIITPAVAFTHQTTGATGFGVAPSALSETYEITAWSLSFGYTVAPGLKWYAEFAAADFDHSLNSVCAATTSACYIDADNEAIALISGLVLSF